MSKAQKRYPTLTSISLHTNYGEKTRYYIDWSVRSPRVDRIAIKQGRFEVDFTLTPLFASKARYTRASEASSRAIPHVFVTSCV